ncbi:MAG: non-homologous end-joining DNA ligase [Acidimicrobiia bacterium]
MLATRWQAPFDDPNWWFEVKWDGYRAVLSHDGQIRARSRRGIDLLEPFPELGTLPIPEGVVLDGEIVAFDDEGRPSFDRIQKRTGVGGSGTGDRTAVNYVVFDVLYQGGEIRTGEPYEDRQEILTGLDLPSPLVVTEPTRGSGTALYEAVKARGIEGIVAKRSGSRYLPGRRSPDWRKVSVRRRMRAVVGGYAEGEGARSSTFGSLLLGLWDDAKLRFVGAVGSGFDDQTLVAIKGSLDELERETTPFQPAVRYPGRLHWVDPGIVVNVEFKEWTADSHLRAPVYKGVEIADASEITWENEGPLEPA